MVEATETSEEPLRSPLLYPGGKGSPKIRDILLSLLPYENVQTYVEPYCGGASLFFAKRPHPVEVLNDLDEQVVGLFRVMQDPETYAKLRHRMLHTLYARSEYLRAIEILETGQASLIETAWALLVASCQVTSQALNGLTPGRWRRCFTSRGSGPHNVSSWLARLALLPDWHRRLLMAQIDCRDALEVIRYWDREDTIFYLDPPYHPDVRPPGLYRVEADGAHHEALVELLMRVRGHVILSGYAHPVYRRLEEAGWQRKDIPTVSFMAGRNRTSGLQGKGAALAKVPRVESLWLSPRLPGRQLTLDEAALEPGEPC